MIKINLLPYRADRKKEQIVQQSFIAAAPLLLSLIVIGILWFTLNQKIADAKNQIVTLHNKIESSKVKMKEINENKKKKETLQNKMAVIANLQKNKGGPVHVLDDLASNLPGSLWLTELKQKGKNLHIKGRALDNISISNYMVNLGGSKFLKNVDLKEIKTAQTRGAQGALIKDFIIICNVAYIDDPVDNPRKRGKKKKK